VDLLADLPPGLSLFGLGRAEADLEAIIGTRVELIPAQRPEAGSAGPASSVTWSRCELPDRQRLADIQAAIDAIRFSPAAR